MAKLGFTTLDFINNGGLPTGIEAGRIIETNGFYTIGDGGAGSWVSTGNIITASQTPALTGTPTLSDANGNEFELVLDKVGLNVLKLGAKWDGSTDDTAVVQAALNSDAKVILLPRGSGVISASGLSMKSDQSVIGVSRDATRITVEPNSTTILFNVTLAGGSYKQCRLRDFAVSAIGSTHGLSIVKTPLSTTGFTNKHSFFIENILSTGTVQWTNAFDIGDHLTGCASRVDIRGSYDTSSEDSTQPVTTAITIASAGSCYGFDINQFKISGYRTSIEIGDGIEAFYITDGEATNSWRGIYSLPSFSSPGGSINNVHLSANGLPIKIARRRNFSIDNVQLYRTTGTAYDHTDEWNGLLLDTCSRANIGNINVRHPDDYKSSSARIGVKLASCATISVAGISTGYESGLTDMLNISNSDAISAEGLVCDTVTNSVITIDGACTNISTGPVAYYGTVPTAPVQITNLVDTIKVSRKSTWCKDFENYTLTSSSSDISAYAGIDGKHLELVDTETSTAYTHTTTLNNDNAISGDEFTFRVVVNAAEKATLVIENADSSTTRIFTTAGDYNLTWIFNGAKWTVKSLGSNAT